MIAPFATATLISLLLAGMITATFAMSLPRLLHPPRVNRTERGLAKQPAGAAAEFGFTRRGRSSYHPSFPGLSESSRRYPNGRDPSAI